MGIFKLSKVVEFQPSFFSRGNDTPRSQIIAVGGGKGGVGKSFFSSNLAIFLSHLGHKTIIIDLDLGAANLHTSLGEAHPNVNFHEYLSDKITDLENCAVSTQFPNLRMISGSNDDHVKAEISIPDRSKLMSAIHNLEADFIVLDLSAGTHDSTLDFFLMAQEHLIVFSPDPSSIENAYRFMKAAFFRRVKRFEKQLQLESVVQKLMADPAGNNIRFPADLVRAITKEEPEKGMIMIEKIKKIHFQTVLNQVRLSKDIELGLSVCSVAKKYFGIPSDHLGSISHDNAVWQALRKRKPLLLEYPHSPIYSQILRIARKFITNKDSKKQKVAG